MTRPRVSVIVTVYKRTEFLVEALRSVTEQTYRDYEVLVADDSGTGIARAVVATVEHDGALVYLANPSTVGVARSLVHAVERARGEFIAILNDDDVWEKEFLAELVPPLIADPRRVASFSDYWLMNESGEIDRTGSEKFSADFGRARLHEGVISRAYAADPGIPVVQATLFRKDAVNWNEVVPEVGAAYDYWISCLLARGGRPIYYVPKRLARWRLHAAMESSRRSHDKADNLIYILSTILEGGWFTGFERVFKRKLAVALFTAAQDKLQFELFRESRRLFWRSFLLRLDLMALAGAAGTFLHPAARKRIWACLCAVARMVGISKATEAERGV